jgi:hypothetical protein
MLIAAFAGTGKTTLAKLYPKMVVDFTCMPYKYELDQNGNYTEVDKANFDYVLHDDWPLNYFQAIKQILSDDKIILIPSDIYVLSLLRSEKKKYTLCYPHRNAKEAYRKRFLDRGNTENFIDIFIGGWDSFLDSLEQDSYGQHIVMQDNQFLSDVISVKLKKLLVNNDFEA